MCLLILYFVSPFSLQQICALLRVCLCTEVFLFTVKKRKKQKNVHPFYYNGNKKKETCFLYSNNKKKTFIASQTKMCVTFIY
jgi:hypothetical protein